MQNETKETRELRTLVNDPERFTDELVEIIQEFYTKDHELNVLLQQSIEDFTNSVERTRKANEEAFLAKCRGLRIRHERITETWNK